MAGLFSRKSGKSKIQFVDLDGQPLKDGDNVILMIMMAGG